MFVHRFSEGEWDPGTINYVFTCGKIIPTKYYAPRPKITNMKLLAPITDKFFNHINIHTDITDEFTMSKIIKYDDRLFVVFSLSGHLIEIDTKIYGSDLTVGDNKQCIYTIQYSNLKLFLPCINRTLYSDLNIGGAKKIELRYGNVFVFTDTHRYQFDHNNYTKLVLLEKKILTDTDPKSVWEYMDGNVKYIDWGLDSKRVSKINITRSDILKCKRSFFVHDANTQRVTEYCDDLKTTYHYPKHNVLDCFYDWNPI